MKTYSKPGMVITYIWNELREMRRDRGLPETRRDIRVKKYAGGYHYIRMYI